MLSVAVVLWRRRYILLASTAMAILNVCNLHHMPTPIAQGFPSLKADMYHQRMSQSATGKGKWAYPSSGFGIMAEREEQAHKCGRKMDSRCRDYVCKQCKNPGMAGS